MKRLSLWSLFCTMAFCVSCPAFAHPLALSYIDLHIGSTGIEASIDAPARDIGHDLSVKPRALLTSAGLEQHRQRLAALLTSRLRLEADGKVLMAQLQDIEPVQDQKDVRLRLIYAWRQRPSTLATHCRLFPYDPRHKTFIDVYEGQVLKQQLIFDNSTAQQTYVLGRRQSTLGVIYQFLMEGVSHIFTGPDHILFIIGLLLLGGTLKQLLQIVTAFTLAHSVTLALATLNIVNPPARIIEPAIALSIVFVGLHSMLYRESEVKRDPRLLFAFAFGFIHGFGFANALREMQLPQQALIWSLFSFNLGVECGQACIVLTVAPLLALLRQRSALVAARVVLIGSVSVILAGAFWFVQRVFAA